MDIFDTDSYKASHFLQYPPETEALFGYLESRGGMYKDTLMFGTRLLQKALSKPVTMLDVEQAAEFMAAHGEPFPLEGWKRIVEKHHGYMPVRIRAVPEGTVVPVRNALLTVETVDPELPWVMGWLETQIMRLWYPITVATRSLQCKRVIAEYLEDTCDNPLEALPFKLHDFGSRGVSSAESAGIGGAAHLVNFMGTDTIVGCRWVHEHYDVQPDDPVGFSIPAMEHATVTSWGRHGEKQAFLNMLKQNTKAPIVACVSDSYDIFKAVENLWCDELLEDVQESGKTVVIRPDSGDPVDVNLKLARIIEKKIGCRRNMKGYKVFPNYFRLIQGDGNNDENDIRDILQALKLEKFSAENIAFGMGGGLLQKLDRDTQKFAFKVSAAKVSGTWRDVFKDPVTDTGKRSKKGRLDLILGSSFTKADYKTIPLSPNQERDQFSALRTIYDVNNNPGEVPAASFGEVRANAQREFV
jgi:nicotinamide phosphoribosyltransferase